MRVEVGCRSCGGVDVDAGDLHVRLLPAGFGPCADFLCPVCGTRRSYGITYEDALRLVPHGALVVDCSGDECPADDCSADDFSADCPRPGEAPGPLPGGPAPERPGHERRGCERPGCESPGRSLGLPPLGPRHAAELRDLLATDGWIDEV